MLPLLLFLMFIPLYVNAEPQYLYDVLKNEAESNGLAREYSGEHHDSFAEEPSKKIYHWYASNDSKGNQILEKNNVIFANQCWQMIRTTDTGGVKMIYNGEAVDNQCLSTRGTHVGYASRTSQNLASNYWYGTDYTYDSVAKTFKVSGTTEQTMWNESNGPGLVGKYTCKLTSEDGSCATLYLVESYGSSTTAYVLSLSPNTLYSSIGKLPFSSPSNSLGYSGYMYGDLYNVKWTTGAEGTFSNAYNTLLSSTTLNTAYWYADSYQYNSTTKKYTLINPFKVSSTDDYNDLKGKYTFRNTDENYTTFTVYYIHSINNSNMYYKQLSNGNSFDNSLSIGDSITDNNDGTYTINNPQIITLEDWMTNYNNYRHKYTCNNSSITCTNPYLITFPQLLAYQYTRVNNKMLIAKRRDGVQLLDTRIVGGDEMELFKNELQDYIYTCSTTSDLCTEKNIRRITDYSYGYYYYINHYYFGTDVTWDGSKYILVDPIDFDDFYNEDKKNTHHYMCMPMGEKSCTTVSFVGHFNTEGTRERIFYINLSNGEKIDDALQKILKNNTNNSILKTSIDAWYQKNMLVYSDYLEDTIFCNNRILKEGNGWTVNGDLNDAYSYFNEYDNKSSLDCKNITDQFSVSNPNAKLKYKAGLLRTSEITIMNNKKIASSANSWWTISPRFYHMDAQIYNDANNNLIASDGSDIGNKRYYYYNSENNEVRPAISVNKNARIISGTGSKENPYQLSFNPIYSVNVQIVNETKDLDINIKDMSQVEEGEEVSFTVTPVEGYKLKDIQILDSNNNEVLFTETEVDNQYIFTMPASNVTIIPSYKKNRFKVNVMIKNEEEDFNINVEDMTSVLEGENVVFKVTPITGYKVKSIQILDSDNHELSYTETNNKNEYNFVMPESDVIIIPSYERVSNSISVDENEHTKEITIQVNDVSAVIYEDTVIFSVEPERGYEVDTIDIMDKDNNRIDYSKTENKNEYMFIMPASDVTIKANYKKVSNSVNVEDKPNTKEFIIEVNDSKAVVYEDTVKFKIIPEEGYEAEKIEIIDKNNIKIEYKKTDNDNEYEFTMPDTDVLIIPTYRKIESVVVPNTLKNPNTGTGISNIIIMFMLIISSITYIVFKRKKNYIIK